MKTIQLLLLFTAMAMVDVPRIRRKKKELLVYSILLGGAYLLSELHVLRIKLWGLNQIVMKVVEILD